MCKYFYNFAQIFESMFEGYYKGRKNGLTLVERL